MYHTTPNTILKIINKYKKHPIRHTGLAQDQGKIKHTKTNKHLIQTNPVKGWCSTQRIYTSIYITKKLKEARTIGLTQYQHTKINNKKEKINSTNLQLTK